MRAWSLAIMVVAMACTDTPGEQLANDLKDACEAKQCPDDPPEYINCMPVYPAYWEPVCGGTCRDFLQHTCRIGYVE